MSDPRRMTREENVLFDFMSSFPGSAAESFRVEYVRLRHLSAERALRIEDLMPWLEVAAGFTKEQGVHASLKAEELRTIRTELDAAGSLLRRMGLTAASKAVG